jgi:hypothetical protein
MEASNYFAYAGPWVEFTSIQYNPESRSRHWRGKILVAMPGDWVEIQVEQKVLASERGGSVRWPMSKMTGQSLKHDLPFWIYPLSVPMDDVSDSPTEVQYTIWSNQVRINCRFYVAPATSSCWSILDTHGKCNASSIPVDGRCYLQIQHHSYEELRNLGPSGPLASIPFLCQDWYDKFAAPYGASQTSKL